MTRTGETLEELIAANKGHRSYEELSKACGGTPVANRLQFMATKGIRDFPSPVTVENLSIALDVSVLRIVLAASRSLGLNVASVGANDLTLPGAGRLPQSQKDLLIDMNRALLAAVNIQ